MQTVSQIKNHYKSLRLAWRMTDMHWSQFHRCTSLYKRKQVERKFKRKLNTEEVKSIEDFFETEDASFPLPDKKYSGKRFMKHSLARTCKMYNMLSSMHRKIAEVTLRKYKLKFVKLQGKYLSGKVAVKCAKTSILL